MSASVILSEPNLRVDAGDVVTCEVAVRNTGTVVDEYTVKVLGDPARWASVEPTSVSLLPGTQESVRIVFNPPRSPQVSAGAWPYGVRVTSAEDPAGVTVHEGTIQLGAYADHVAELVPHTSQARRTARHELAVDNRGNAPLRATITGADDDNKLTFRARPERLDAISGTATFARVRVRPRKLHWWGNPVTHPFRVLVTPEASPGQAGPDGGKQGDSEPDAAPEPTVVSGAFVQRAVIPRWLPLALLIALLALLALLALWFFLLKPTVESTAREAVSGDVAQAEEKAAAAAGQAQQAAEKATAAGEQAAAAASGAESPPFGASSATPEGDPFDRRFALTMTADGGTDDDVFVVPKDRTLALTDLVLQNPQGDDGTLVVDRGDGNVLTFELRNFRDWDYHFVSPIIVGPEEELRVEGACRTPGPDADRCRPAVLLGGFLGDAPPPP